MKTTCRILTLIMIIVLVFSIQSYAATGVSGSMSWTRIGGSSSSSSKTYDEDVIAQKGSKGETVKKIQEKLIELGYLNDKADGVFGNNTKNAVAAFQKANRLDETGKVMQEEYDLLFVPEPTSSPTPTPIPTATPTPTLTPTPAPTSYINKEGWCVSNDRVAEIKAISFEELSYPEYELTLKFRLEGSIESDQWVYTYDITPLINQFIVQNPEYKNRKVKASLIDGIFSFDLQNATVYNAKSRITLGNNTSYPLSTTIDLSTIYPDDFINYDALNAATFIKAYKEMLLNPDSMVLDSIFVSGKPSTSLDEEITFYTFTVKAENKAGGMSESTIIARYNTYNGKYDLIDKTNYKVILAGIESYISQFSLDMVMIDYDYREKTEIPLASVKKYL